MSVDYDPQKAHEYYEKHKKLKGRSKKGMSQKQKEQIAYATDQLKGERTARTKQVTAKIDADAKAKREAMIKQAKELIKRLKASIEMLPPDEKKDALMRLSGKIEAVKSNLAKKKKALSKSTSEAKKKARADSTAQYEKDLDAAYKKVKG